LLRRCQVLTVPAGERVDLGHVRHVARTSGCRGAEGLATLLRISCGGSAGSNG
jgi:hypothetical protein